MTNTARSARILAGLGALALFAGACSDDGGGSSTSDSDPTTDAAGEGLTILVTNDDGVEGEGIAVLAEVLAEIPGAEVVVYAPADDRTGAGNDVSSGPVETSESELVNGFPAVAVDGTPADSVNTALEEGVEPDVVVSGINFGPNLGEVAENLSGTIGAARAAANAGVPALAVSQGLGDPLDYETGADIAADWVTEREDALIDGTEPVVLVSFNVPTCATGEVRGPVEVPLAEVVVEGAVGETDCAAGTDEQTDDGVAFVNGYATLTVLDLD